MRLFRTKIVGHLFQRLAFCRPVAQPLHVSSCRLLYSDEILGVDLYLRHRSYVEEKLGTMKGQFLDRIVDYIGQSNRNPIFIDDLKTMSYLAETEAELEVFYKMIQRYNQQNKRTTMFSFRFGPIAMRLFHLRKRPDMAYRGFRDPDLQGFFDQHASYLVLMDLLFESKQYDRVLEVMDSIQMAENRDSLYLHHDFVTLTIASCYRINTRESYEKMNRLVDKCSSVDGRAMSMRSIVYAVMLCLNQDEPQRAWQILNKMRKTKNEPVAIRNVKILTLVQIEHLDAAVDVLSSIMEADVPQYALQSCQVFSDVLVPLQTALEQSSQPQLLARFNGIVKGLRQCCLVSDERFTAYIFKPVIRQRRKQDSVRKLMMRTPHSRQIMENVGLGTSEETLVGI